MTEWRFGPSIAADGVTFRVWAPAQSELALVLDDEADRPMARSDDGFFRLHVPGAHAGQRYWYRLGQHLRPDPASRSQPDGPLGASAIVDPASFEWSDHAWRGAGAAHRHVIYEMHIGTYTREGTWDAAVARLPALADIGITTLEVMPIAEFGGRFGWGYDGVNLFAPTRLYGTPDDTRRFVDEAHRLGLAVILDVVYNHFGPVGNFAPEFSATFFGKPGEWGDLINYDGPGSTEVRRFVCENAAYWIAEFHFDGLRFDATQAFHDESDEHIIAEIAWTARQAAGSRAIFLVGESEPQDTTLLRHTAVYRDGLDAIWNEDWHHAAFVCATGRRQAYFTDYLGSAAEFASMARHGTLYQGQWYTWQHQPRGSHAIGLPGCTFVSFLENHDQVANTGLGWRLHQHVDRGRWRALTTLLLLGPALPQLFQGQEFASTRPFIYFADHEGDLGAMVESGRLAFLAQFPGLSSSAMRARLPRPGDPDTFARCKLDDDQRSADSASLRLHRDLLRLRHTDAVLRAVGTAEVGVESSSPAAAIVLIRYIAAAGDRLLVANLADDHVSPMNDPLFAPRPGTRWRVGWSSEDPSYDGNGAVPFVEAGRWRIHGNAAMLLASEPNQTGPLEP